MRYESPTSSTLAIKRWTRRGRRCRKAARKGMPPRVQVNSSTVDGGHVFPDSRNWTNEGAQIGRAHSPRNVKGTITSWCLLGPVPWPISQPRSRAMTMIRCALSSARSKRLTRQESKTSPHIPCALQQRRQWPQEPWKQSQQVA